VGGHWLNLKVDGEEFHKVLNEKEY